MTPYFLCRDVYLCITDDCIVLLHLPRDQYIALKPARSNRLVGHVSGWPHFELHPSSSAPVDPSQPPEALLAEMVTAGLLTTDPASGHAAAPTKLDSPAQVLCPPDFKAKPRFHVGDLCRLGIAYLIAATVLKTGPLHAAIQRVQRRRARQQNSEADLDRARRLTVAFLDWRTLFYTPRRKCQLDSLALIEFLALAGVFPMWVFGVQTGPFAAHCWVQIGAIACNDTPDNVRRFTPIFAA